MKQKYYKFHLHMSEPLYAELRKQSQEAGMTMNKLLMQRLIELTPFVFSEEKIATLAAQTNRQGERINDIARAFNSGYGIGAMLTEDVDIMKDIVAKSYALVLEKRQAEQA